MQKTKKNNLQLAGLFVVLVLGLIFLSLFFKVIIIIKDSKFDGNHKFNVLIQSKTEKAIISFSPKPRSVSVIRISEIQKGSVQGLEVPIDGIVLTEDKIYTKQLSTFLLKSAFPLGNKVEKLTFFDLLRLALFSRTIPHGAIYQREITDKLNKEQTDTIISLTFIDPTIYEENKNIEIINASSLNGEGAKLAAFVTNIGGNVVLVTSSSTEELESKIIYYGEKSYTVKRLSSYFNIPVEESKKREIADVIIIIGKDILKKYNFNVY